MSKSGLTSIPDHRLPPGVPRALWEYAHDQAIARDYDEFTARSPLLDLDGPLLFERLTTPGRLIDLGCGTGRLAVGFAKRGFYVTGVDLSREMLHMAAAKAAAANVNLSLVQANLCELDCFAPGTFDVALLMFGTLGMIEGAGHRRRVLQNVAELLRPGGIAALHVHNVWSHLFFPGNRRWLAGDRFKALSGKRSAGDRRSPYRGIPNMFIHYFSQRELRRELVAAGLAIREMIPLSLRQDAPLPPNWFNNYVRAGGWIVFAERRADS